VEIISVKPGLHQQQCRSNIVVVTGNSVACCFDIVAGVDGVLWRKYIHQEQRTASCLSSNSWQLVIRTNSRKLCRWKVIIN